MLRLALIHTNPCFNIPLSILYNICFFRVVRNKYFNTSTPSTIIILNNVINIK